MAAAFLIAVSSFIVAPAQARPPTVTISPGYDRALAESRRARGAGMPDVVAPAPRAYRYERPVPRTKRRHYRRY
jgi:hypothetical protein